MTVNKNKLKIVGKRFLQLFLFFIILLVISLSIGWHILKSDHEYVLKKIRTTTLEKYNADLDLTGYQIEFTKPFPLIEFQFQGLSIASHQNPEHPLLKISQASSTFQPWDLLSENFQTQSFIFDSVWVHFHKDELVKSNLDFGERKTEISSSKKSRRIDFDIKKLPNLTINYLDFIHQNESKETRQWAKMHQVVIQPQQNENQNWVVNLVSDTFFEELLFKKKDGGFLVKERGKLDLNIGIEEEGKVIYLENSSLEIYDKSKFLLEAKFTLADTNRFELQIANEGVTMQTVLPMLSEEINRTLKDIRIDQPIAAKFSMDKYLKSGKREVVEVDFATQSAQLIFQGVEMNEVSLKGNFSNDFDHDGIGDLATAYLTVDQLDGDILGVLPIQLSGTIEQLKNPYVKALGKMNIDMTRLNALLAAKDKFTFTDGRAIVDFEYEGELMNLLNSPFDEQDIRLVGDAYFNDMTVKTDNRYAPSPSLSGHLAFNENLAMLDSMSLEWMGSNVLISGQVGNLPEFLFFEDEALTTQLNLQFDEITVNDFLENPSTENELSNNTITKKSNQKQTIEVLEPLNYQRLERMTRRLASSVNGKVNLSIDRLNYDTLFVTDLKTQFKLFTPRRAEYVDSFMIQVRQLSANFMGTTPLYLELGLSRDSITGVQVDLDVPSANHPAKVFLPKNITWNEGDASVKLSAIVPLRYILQPKQLLPHLKYDGKIKFENVGVDAASVDFPIRKISGLLSFDDQQVIFDNLDFNYSGSPFFLDGKIENHSFFSESSDLNTFVDLELRGAYLNLKKTKSPVVQKNNATTKETPSVLTSMLSPTEMFQSLDTIFQMTTGKIDLKLDSILTNQQTISPFLLQAQLLANEENSEDYLLQIDSFNLGFGKENNIKGNAQVKNSIDPMVEAHFKARMKLDKLGEFLTSDFIEMKEGYFNMDLDYQSPLFDTISAENYLLKAEVHGEAEIVDGKIVYNYRDFIFNNIFAHFSFDKKTVFIRDVDLEVNENRIFASGQALDFFSFFILPNERAKIELKIDAPRFDFGNFTAPHGLGKDTMTAFVNKMVQNNRVNQTFNAIDSTINVMEKTGSLIDQLLDQGSMEMSVNCQELVYSDFMAENIAGKISFQPDSVQLKNLNMDVAEGKFMIDGAISNVALHQPKMEVEVQMKQNDVSEIFRQFDDFGQTELGFKNIRGIASAKIYFQTEANSNYAILPSSMNGDMDITLTGGQLLEVAALKKVSGFLFRKRRMNKILMDTLQTSMHIRGTDLYIDDFLLHSSSFDFGLQGIYSFEEENKTRILFKIPISNIYKRHVTTKELKSGKSKRKGIRILIEARKKKKRMRFRWKIFNWKNSKYELEEETINHLNLQKTEH